MPPIRAAVVAIWLVAPLVAQSVPHQGDGLPYDDELYRHLIFDDSDRMGTNEGRSWVLPYHDPQFYIRLGSATKCAHAWRLSWREMHYWRAVVGIISKSAQRVRGKPPRSRDGSLNGVSA